MRVNTNSASNVFTIIDDGSDGLVGIGTTSQTIKFEVVGDASVSSKFGIGTNPLVKFHILTANPVNEPFIFQAATAGSDPPAIFFFKHRGTQASPTATLLNDKIGRLGWQSFGTSQKDVASMFAQATEDHTVTNLGTKIFWDTTTNGASVASTKMTLASNGFLGINTTTPGALVNVVSDNDAPFLASFRNTSFSAAETGAFRFFITNAGILTQKHNNLNFLKVNASGEMSFGSVGTPTGSVKVQLIGNNTSNAEFSMHARGNSAATGLVVSNANLVGVGLNPTARMHIRGIDDLAGSDALIVENNSASDLFHIQNNGNIGVNTASPGERLHVTGNIRTDFAKIGATIGGGSNAYFTQVTKFTNAGYAVSQTPDGLTTLNSITGQDVQIAVNNVVMGKFDESSTALDTRFFIYDVDNGQLERVTVGAADSGGTNFKLLRIAN